MKPLLIILPSRGRPDRIKECIDSYLATTDGTFSELSIQLDTCDPKFDEYRAMLKEYDPARVSYVVRARPSARKEVYCLTRIINRAFYADKNRDYYCVINDDMVFETQDWDKTLALPWCISTGKERNMIAKYGDRIGNTMVAGFPIISVVDGRIPRALGWLQMPELGGCCGDNAWYWIGLNARNLIYNDKVVYAHNHYAFDLGAMDDTYSPVYGNDNAGAIEDFKRFIDWGKYRAKGVIKIVKDLIQENIGTQSSQGVEECMDHQLVQS